MFNVWYSTEIFADYIINHTELRHYDTNRSRLMESDANNPTGFHRMPDHIKKILYLDAPDLIVEYNSEPIFSIEVSREAGTGHNAFQRFGRILASVENGVPALYIYPRAVQITRQARNGETVRWDELNPNIFMCLERTMRIHGVPSLLFYYPSMHPDNDVVHPNKGLIDDDLYLSCPSSEDGEMQSLFAIINLVVRRALHPTRVSLINEREIQSRRDWLMAQYNAVNNPAQPNSPLTSIVTVETEQLLAYLSNYGYDRLAPSLLSSRNESVIYQVDAAFRGDPYPGTLAALDYLTCRNGTTFEDRYKNLVLCWGRVTPTTGNIVVTNARNTSINDMMSKIQLVKSNDRKCLLGNTFETLQHSQIPRYYMQVRYGCTYTKQKEIRGYAYLADAILFPDGALWREA